MCRFWAEAGDELVARQSQVAFVAVEGAGDGGLGEDVEDDDVDVGDEERVQRFAYRARRLFAAFEWKQESAESSR